VPYVREGAGVISVLFAHVRACVCVCVWLKEREEGIDERNDSMRRMDSVVFWCVW
jgi:hypothetical protein